MGRTITLICSIILIIIIGVTVSTLIYTSKSKHILPPDPVLEAITKLSPLHGCSKSSSVKRLASDGFPEARVLIMNCSSRTAATLDSQIITQLREQSYEVQPSNAPQWGCYEKTDGSTVCSDEINAHKSNIRARYIVVIPDATAEADPALGNRESLSPVAVSSYRLQLSR